MRRHSSDFHRDVLFRAKMGLTTSDSRPESHLPPLARNPRCHGGSDRKYKRCCQEREERIRHQQRPVVLPLWPLNSRSKLHQFEKICL